MGQPVPQRMDFGDEDQTVLETIAPQVKTRPVLDGIGSHQRPVSCPLLRDTVGLAGEVGLSGLQLTALVPVIFDALFVAIAQGYLDDQRAVAFVAPLADNLAIQKARRAP